MNEWTASNTLTLTSLTTVLHPYSILSTVISTPNWLILSNMIFLNWKYNTKSLSLDLFFRLFYFGPHFTVCFHVGPHFTGCFHAGPHFTGCFHAGPHFTGCFHAGPHFAVCFLSDPTLRCLSTIVCGADLSLFVKCQFLNNWLNFTKLLSVAKEKIK